MQTLGINDLEYRAITAYIYNLCGIHLTDEKRYLIENRLGPIVKKYNYSNYSELYFKAKTDSTNQLDAEIVDAITTNETSFFRDGSPFELLTHKIIPEFYTQNSQSTELKIWSAASSTGQELYSIVMVLRELLGTFEGYNIRILGTDISDDMISKASRAAYSQFELNRGLSERQIQKYFHKRMDNLYYINDELRSICCFQKFNLFDSFMPLGKFDIIFLRNVAIYFNLDDKKYIFDRLADQLKPGGLLIIGSTESLLGVTEKYQSNSYKNSIYYTVA